MSHIRSVHPFQESMGRTCYYCDLPVGNLIHDVQPGDTAEEVAAAQDRFLRAPAGDPRRQVVYLVRYEDAHGTGVESVFANEKDANERARELNGTSCFAWVDDQEVQ